MRIAVPVLLLGALLFPPAGAHADSPADRLTPSASPIVSLPHLTPTGSVLPPLDPSVVWEHPPEAPAPLSPLGSQAGPVRSAEPPAIATPPLPPAKPRSEPPPQPAAKPPSAGPAQRMVTATAGIYLRATPDAKGRVLDTVEKGERMTAFGAPADGWQRVGRAGKPQGYVTGAYLAEAAPETKAAPAATPTATPKPGRYAKADPEDRGCALPDDLPERARSSRLSEGTVARLRAAGNLRVAPVCDAKVVDVLETGERVTVLEAAGGWYKVGRKGKALGYVGAALLTPLKR
ncbi:SH3 domain-containing protein [Azospirillum endophyticum]